MKRLLPKVSLYAMSGFYLFAGANHFINPDFYLPLIPEYFPSPATINVLSGVAELLLGLGLLVEKTRKISAYLIIAMLVAFIPSHVYFIEIGSCIEDGLCVPEWIGFIRLIVIHPLLIWWAWSNRELSTH